MPGADQWAKTRRTLDCIRGAAAQGVWPSAEVPGLAAEVRSENSFRLSLSRFRRFRLSRSSTRQPYQKAAQSFQSLQPVVSPQISETLSKMTAVAVPSEAVHALRASVNLTALVSVPPLGQNCAGRALRPLQRERLLSPRRVATVAKDD